MTKNKKLRKNKTKKIKIVKVSTKRKIRDITNLNILANTILSIFSISCDKNECNEKCKCNRTWDTPITSIDNIPCNCKIKLYHLDNNKIKLTFSVYSNYIKEEDCNDLYCIYESFGTYNDFINGIIHFSAELLQKLKNLKLLPNGELAKKDIIYDNTLVFNNIPSIKTSLSLEECSVCLEKTKTKTLCHHPLCFRCMFSLRPQENNRFNIISCPICRENITHFNNKFCCSFE